MGEKMFRKLFERNISKVESLEDLRDERARRIASGHNLDVKEILPRYLELTKEVLTNGGQIEINMDNPTTPINVHEEYKRKVACGAVISYELTTREAIQFPVAEKSAVLDVGQEAFLMSVKLKGNIHRTAPVLVYEQIGKYYEQIISMLNQHQGANLAKML
jgi:hypothetical protein